MKKVCFILNNPFIYDNRVQREAEALVQQGYDVTLLAVKDPSGKMPEVEVRNGIRVHRLLKKKLNHYAPVQAFRLLKYTLNILFKLGTFDVIHAHDADTLQLAEQLAKVTRARLVYDSHELWNSEFEVYERSISTRLQDKPKEKQKKLAGVKRMADLERALIKKCDALISVNPSICDLIQEHAKAKVPLCEAVRNIPPRFTLPAPYSTEQKPRLFHEYFKLSPETKVVLYQGGITHHRGITHLLDAMALLAEEPIALVIMGQLSAGYKEAFERKMATLADSVYYRDAVYGDDFPLWTASADLGIHPILNTEVNHYYCLPNKIFEYIQAEIPVAVSAFPEMSRIVNEAQVGFTFNPENSQEIADKVKAFFADPAGVQEYQLNLKRAKLELSWEVEQKKLIDLYAGLLA